MNTEGHALGPHEPVPDELILAAIDRAARHGTDEVWIATIGEHLGFAHTPHNTRRLRARLEQLRGKERCLERLERHGREYWSLTATGESWLRALRHEGKLGDLPESPQHREWRLARATASERIDRFRELLSDALEDGYSAATAHIPPSSQAWLELSERLAAAFWLLGSAIYCRDEWAEPDDAHADIDPDPGPPPGRRAVGAWEAKEALAKGEHHE